MPYPITITRRHLAGLAALGPLALVAPSAWGAPSAQPRLFFSPDRLARARSWKTTDLAAAWRSLRATCDALHTKGPARFAEHAASPDKERGWQREIGNSAASLAAASLLGDQAADRDLAIAHVAEAATYPVWGRDDMDGADLAAGHLLFGTAMVLDWLGEGMEAATRTTLVETLRRRGAQMDAAARGTNGKPAYWSQAWMENHLWVNMGGLLAAGLALQRDDPEAAQVMIATATDRMTHAFAALPPDGSSQEGPGYWDYGAEYLLKVHDMMTGVLGRSLDGRWLGGAAAYRAAMTLPQASWSRSLSMVDQADAPISPWTGPEYMLRRLAALNHDGAAQELAAKLEAAGAVFPAATWLNFAWYDPSVRPAGMAELPLLQHFEDLDIVAARSDRSGRESLVVMRAGPPLGKQAQAQHYPRDIGVAHTHPDVNHVTLFAGGAFLLRDDGYAGIKDTAHHNTLLVNNQGQLGSGRAWTGFPHYPLPDPQPSMRVVTSEPALDYWVGEGASAYPAATGLRRFDRHVLFVKPDILVVVDDLEAAQPAAFTLLWHPGAASLPTGEQRYTASLSGVALHMAFVVPQGASSAAAQRSLMSHEQKAVAMDEVAVTMSGTAGQVGALFQWAPASAPPPLAKLSQRDGAWLLEAAGHRITLRPRERAVARA